MSHHHTPIVAPGIAEKHYWRDVTYADVTALKNTVGFEPATPLADGITRRVVWYKADSRA